MARLNVNDARCEALFASRLQPSDAPTAEAMLAEISAAIRQFGIRGCASRMAQEFGDHPEAALDRMRWARRLVGEVPASPAARRAEHGGPAPARLFPPAAPTVTGGARRAA
jgi:hypothetical protein